LLNLSTYFYKLMIIFSLSILRLLHFTKLLTYLALHISWIVFVKDIGIIVTHSLKYLPPIYKKDFNFLYILLILLIFPPFKSIHSFFITIIVQKHL
jgi:hypothetical protein